MSDQKDEKYFEKLQNDHIEKFSKRTTLTTSKVLYTTFSPKSKEPGEIVIMLEKLYHPSDVIHVHYLREQTEAEKIEMDEQQSSQQHQQNSFNYRAGSIDENLFGNGFLQREVPRDTLQKAKVEESKIVQEESKNETQETQGLDKSSLHSPIQINPSVADHYIRTKTTEVKISSHQSALANAVSKSVKFKIDPLINEEEEEKTKSILDKNTTSVIGRSP